MINTFIFFLIFLFCKSAISEDIDQRIRQYLLENPEVIIKSLENYEIRMMEEERKKNNEIIKKKKKIIFDSSNGMFEGEETAKKIIVEFFDYNCSYCKKAHKDLQRIIKNFSDVKVIYKNLPILSKQSKRLAKLSLLIAKDSNEKFKKFHNFLLEKKGLINNNDVDKFLVKLGFSLKKINENLDNKYINSQIEKDFQLAKELSLSGTPAFIIKNNIIFGYRGYDELTNYIKN